MALVASTTFVVVTPQSAAAAEATIPSLWVVDDTVKMTYNVTLAGWAQRVVRHPEGRTFIYRG